LRLRDERNGNNSSGEDGKEGGREEEVVTGNEKRDGSARRMYTLSYASVVSLMARRDVGKRFHDREMINGTL